jgi:hypothetical protein
MRLKLAALALLALSGALGTSSLQGSVLQHERLRVRNTFKTPEEVVSYYCARDASGFVWSGLLDAERKAFTVWSEAPSQDSFYVAKNYEVNPGRLEGGAHDRAVVQVRYQVTAIADAHGTKMPVPRPELVVNFDLQKIGGAWKIARPAPTEISPVVLESKFPMTAVQ